MSAPNPPPRDHWEEFRSWHRESSLYREIYARTVATLAAAGVIYLIAAAAGLVSTRPAGILAVTLLLIGVLFLVFSVPGAKRHWNLVHPLFVYWNDDPAPERELARRLYMRLIVGIGSTFMGGVFLAVALVK